MWLPLRVKTTNIGAGLFYWAGKLIGRDYFVLEGTAEEPDEEVLQTFLKQFYHQASYVPPKYSCHKR